MSRVMHELNAVHLGRQWSLSVINLIYNNNHGSLFFLSFLIILTQIVNSKDWQPEMIVSYSAATVNIITCYNQ